ncbi:MAG: alkaline phosphatase [Opitutaceae bacterium]|nr:alkaline phosphatase [Opitutaceae bacterium]
MNLSSLVSHAGFASIVLAAASLSTSAAPTVTRLNPPSALFTFDDSNPPYISRFVTGQRFDLQATVQADARASITAAVFRINGWTVPGGVTITPIGGDRFSVTRRAVEANFPGVHKLTIEATQSDGAKVSDQGNFEVVAFKGGPRGRRAKNVIYLIGDGMGIAHRTAARLVMGNVQMGKAEDMLAMDSLPHTALISTASLNSIVTDSAPGAACYSTGNKSNNNQEGVFPDDTADKWDNPRVEHMGSYLARRMGKALGIVTTADVEDATPASFAVHTQDRGAGTGICDMYLDEAAANANLRVLMGGGRKWFLPQGTAGSGRIGSTTSSGADYVLPADVAAGWGVPTGAIDPTRDLIADFQAAGFYYAPDKATLDATPAGTKRVLGLFNTGNMDVALDKIAERRGGAAVGSVAAFPDQPMLEEMTKKALEVLNRERDGFVLMVEAASIDKQAHNMDTERWILETIEFDRTVQACIDFQKRNPDTLIVVTADHECAGVNIIGGTVVTDAELRTRAASGGGAAQLRSGVVGVYDAAGFPTYGVSSTDGYPTTLDTDKKILIGYAANGDRYEDWLTNPQPNVAGAARDVAGNFFIAGQAAGAGVSTAVHTGSDIPLSAGGRGASLFHGVMDNTDVFFRVLQAAAVGCDD